MAGRHRETTISNESTAWNQYGFYSSYGSCTVNPGESTTPWATHNLSGIAGTDYRFQEMDDVVTPGFERLRAEGKIINSPMSKSYVEESEAILPFTFEYVSNKWGCTPARWYPYQKGKVTGSRSMTSFLAAGLYISPPVVDAENLADIAITGAWARIGYDQVLALSAAAEIGSTFSGLLYLYKKIKKILVAIRKKNLRYLKRELSYSEMEQVYMNARYNLRPLYYDLKGLYSIYETLNSGDYPSRQTFRAKKTETVLSDSDDSEVAILNFGSGGVMVKLHVSRTASTTVVARAGVLTAVEPPSLAQLLGLDAIIESAWDLLPFSFIVDWFLNVGDTISAWTPDIGISALASWAVIETTTTQKCTITGVTDEYAQIGSYLYTPGTCSFPVGGVSTRLTRTKVRIPSYERPMLPRFDLKLDFSKLLDLGIIVKNLRKMV